MGSAVPYPWPVRLVPPTERQQGVARRTRELGFLLALVVTMCGCGASPTASRGLAPLPGSVVRAPTKTGDVLVPAGPKENGAAKAAMAASLRAERAAVAELPPGSKVVTGSLFVLADAPGPGGPSRVLAWVLQTVPKGGYPGPSCGPALAGHRPHCPEYNLRVDFVNALTGKWVMATETSTMLGRGPGAGSARQGVVVGGIWPCQGIVAPPVRFGAGLVQVLRGTVHFVADKDGSSTVLPRRGVAAQTVSQGKQYRFRLTPGQYVLRLLRDSAHPRTEPPLAFATVTVVAGRTVHANIPDACI